ncbi:MAG: hypothetical protein NZ955_01425 [Candidatus Bathyarchaeota archaeon]|nr:hypothetical protein [Candidatus Bathyarchaeota archaeon]
MSKRKIAAARREVEKLIAQCRLTVKRGADPFQIDMKESLDKLRSFIESASSLDDIRLDGEALYDLSAVVESQDRWVRFRSSRLFVDPLFVESRVKATSNRILARILVSCWTPIASIDTLTQPALDLAIDYWNRLKPLKGRWSRFSRSSMEYLSLSFDEASKLGLLYDKGFDDILSDIEYHVKQLLSVKGRVEYSEIIGVENWVERVTRAYLLSFLISSGRIGLIYDPSTDKFYVTACSGSDQPRSIAISIGMGG